MRAALQAPDPLGNCYRGARKYYPRIHGAARASSCAGTLA